MFQVALTIERALLCDSTNLTTELPCIERLKWQHEQKRPLSVKSG